MSALRRPKPAWAQNLVLFAAVFLSYAAGAQLAVIAFGASELGPAFFPPAGVTVAAMLLTRRAHWPVIVAAIVLAEMAVDLHAVYAHTAIAGYAVANSVEPLLGASVVLALCKGVPDLRLRKDLFFFVAGACLAGPMVGGLIGGATVAAHFDVWWPGAALRWFASDAIGALVVGAPILLWRKQFHVLRERPVEAVGILGTTGALSWLAIWTGLSPSLLILPTLAWAALRLDVLGAALAGLGAALAANLRAASGLTLLEGVGLSAPGRMALIQALIAVNVLLAMLIAQEAAGRASAVAEREIERRERLRLESLSRLAQQLSAALTPEDIGEALVTQVLNEAGATAVSLGLVSEDGQRLDWVAESGYPAAMLEQVRNGVDLSEHTLANEAIRSAAPVAVGDAAAFAAVYPERAHWLRLAGAEAVVSWPLAAGGLPFGVVQMAWSAPQPLNNAQLAYVSAVSTIVSQALVRAKVYTDEHARAAVLHDVAQPVDQVVSAGVQYSALYQPADVAHGLGGDWFSVMALPDSRTYLTVGDVIGHGLPSVQDMARLRSTGDAYAHQGLPPAQILVELNRFAAHQICGEFATALVAIFDPGSNSLTYSSAGHLPALLRRAQTGDVVRLSNASGVMLGPFADSVYVQEAVSVQPGDVLMMYTDGLVEQHDEGLMAGIAHLEQVLASWQPEALLDCEALVAVIAPVVRADDICLLAVRFGTEGPD
jgi:integral membrane sensor domain MASE1